ncbi:MAG: hypothetical protein WCF81_22245 [Roseiarcus sp.]
MNVSLNQAIEIHAKAFKHRFGKRAALMAEEKAHHCRAHGDDEGHAVWLRVGVVAEVFPEVRSLRPLVDEMR